METDFVCKKCGASISLEQEPDDEVNCPVCRIPMQRQDDNESVQPDDSRNSREDSGGTADPESDQDGSTGMENEKTAAGGLKVARPVENVGGATISSDTTRALRRKAEQEAEKIKQKAREEAEAEAAKIKEQAEADKEEVMNQYKREAEEEKKKILETAEKEADDRRKEAEAIHEQARSAKDAAEKEKEQILEQAEKEAEKIKKDARQIAGEEAEKLKEEARQLKQQAEQQLPGQAQKQGGEGSDKTRAVSASCTDERRQEEDEQLKRDKSKIDSLIKRESRLLMGGAGLSLAVLLFCIVLIAAAGLSEAYRMMTVAVMILDLVAFGSISWIIWQHYSQGKKALARHKERTRKALEEKKHQGSDKGGGSPSSDAGASKKSNTVKGGASRKSSAKSQQTGSGASAKGQQSSGKSGASKSAGARPVANKVKKSADSKSGGGVSGRGKAKSAKSPSPSSKSVKSQKPVDRKNPKPKKNNKDNAAGGDSR